MTDPAATQTVPAEANLWSSYPLADIGGDASATTLQKILVVDDTPLNLKVVRAFLAKAGYNRVETVEDSREAMSSLFHHDPDLLILDLMMPHVSGLDILSAVRNIPHFRRLPVIVISAAEERGVKRHSLKLGATDFLGKPLDAEDLILRVRNTLVLKSYQDSLETKVFQRTAELTKSREEVIHCLARAAEYRDNETGNHVIRVGIYVGMMARRMGYDVQASHMMELASTLHDMGKVGIPDAILTKPGPSDGRRARRDEGALQVRIGDLHAGSCRAASGALDARRDRGHDAQRIGFAAVADGQPDRLDTPRTVGRRGLPARPERRRDPGRRTHYRRGRRVRRAEQPTPVQTGL